MHDNVAVPLTFGDVLLMPLLMVKFSSVGAVAVTTACPTTRQVALPLSLIDAVAFGATDHVKPSATVNSRLVLLLKVAFAVNCTSPPRTPALACDGETVILVMVGCPAPHAIQPAAATKMQSRCRARCFIVSPGEELDCMSRPGVGFVTGT